MEMVLLTVVYVLSLFLSEDHGRLGERRDQDMDRNSQSRE